MTQLLIKKEFIFGSGSFKEWIVENSDVQHLVLLGDIHCYDYEEIDDLDILGEDYNIVILDMGGSFLMKGEWFYAPSSKSKCKRIIFPNNMWRIHAGFEFYGVLEEVTFPIDLNWIGGFTFYENYLTEISLPSKLECIDYFAFAANSLKKVYIPDSCTGLDGNAFASCEDLKEIIVSNNHPKYTTINGSLYSKDRTKLILAAPGIETLIIEDGVIEIEEGSINGSCAKSILFPSSIKLIETEELCYDFSDEEEIVLTDLKEVYIHKENKDVFKSIIKYLEKTIKVHIVE